MHNLGPGRARRARGDGLRKASRRGDNRRYREPKRRCLLPRHQVVMDFKRTERSLHQHYLYISAISMYYMTGVYVRRTDGTRKSGIPAAG